MATHGKQTEGVLVAPDAFLEEHDIQFAEVSLPGGKKIRIGSLDADTMMDFVSLEGPEKRQRMLRMIAMSLVDAEDVRVGLDEQGEVKPEILAKLGKKDARTIARLSEAIMIHNEMIAAPKGDDSEAKKD
jgi:hypothetical protein